MDFFKVDRNDLDKLRFMQQLHWRYAGGLRVFVY